MGFWELLLIVIVIFAVFGGKKIPEIMAEFGKGVRAFKKSMEDNERTDSGAELEKSPKTLSSGGESEQDQPPTPRESKSEEISKENV